VLEAVAAATSANGSSVTAASTAIAVAGQHLNVMLGSGGVTSTSLDTFFKVSPLRRFSVSATI